LSGFDKFLVSAALAVLATTLILAVLGI